MFTSKIGVFGVLIFTLLSIGVFRTDTFDIEKDLVFRLYTQENSTEYHVLKANLLPPTAFDPKRPTRIFCHGYKSSEKVLIRYKDGFLKLGNYNFIAVDWILGANTLNYLKAKSRVKPVSLKLNPNLLRYFKSGSIF